MIRAIIRFSAEHRYLVIAMAIVALAFSWYSMKTIPLDALPACPTRRSSSIRSGTAAPTSSKTR